MLKHKLGWALLGPTTIESNDELDVHLLQSWNNCGRDTDLQDLLNRYLHEDGLGAVTSIQKSMSLEYASALKLMEDQAVLIGIVIMNIHYCGKSIAPI